MKFDNTVLALLEQFETVEEMISPHHSYNPNNMYHVTADPAGFKSEVQKIVGFDPDIDHVGFRNLDKINVVTDSEARDRISVLAMYDSWKQNKGTIDFNEVFTKYFSKFPSDPVNSAPLIFSGITNKLGFKKYLEVAVNANRGLSKNTNRLGGFNGPLPKSLRSRKGLGFINRLDNYIGAGLNRLHRSAPTVGGGAGAGTYIAPMRSGLGRQLKG